ncbi:hypothetical protein SPBR_04380 [Sporothrix brasiliensis 5110]|uniref:lytic cellulose monooxygenase (C4-dehydrogenating) n=1 Tax=Sporothrix brasiliensis 5110 TaxID=1398154 RepID=A0A0C2IW66_9PEZI|nr:uncharacterized protein SPBR_04380 [Sporothrix brasiliensis 5110]KIH93401.1 hypothetical protein SPBR_04380 [Sporothrix brasiliensis 5110]
MKSAILAAVALAAQQAAGHAIFQQLWVDGKDMIILHSTSCARVPKSNSPVTSVSSADVVCNAGGRTGVAGKCTAKAGGTVTVEMHQQPGDRNCKSEAIGGAHYGPVLAYMTKVSDAATADGSTQWFKVFEDGWSAKAGAGSGDNDNWGTKDLNACCGRMDIKIPDSLPDGDYLLRAEVIALHTAGQSGGAQLYMSCYQLTLAGGKATALPAGLPLVKFPGAYTARDPGILINIHAAVSKYTVPGPAVVAGGTTKTAGSGCDGCSKTCSAKRAVPFDV